MKKKTAPQKTLIAASLCLAISYPLHAQTLEDVVVSASRSEQSSFDAPGSIQSVDRTVIESAGPQINISEALAGVPGINVANRNNYSQDLQISIRGFGSRAPFGVRGVRLLIDGIPQTLPDGQGQSSQFALTSAERIEVLKGPIAMLYGNAAGGVVQVFTRSAGDKPEFSVTGYAGSDDLFRTSTQYSEKRGPYGLVLDYATFRTDGFREYSYAERNHLNAKLDYQGERGKTTFTANILKNDTQEPGSLTLASYNDPQKIYTAFPDNVYDKFGKEFTQGIFGVSGDYKAGNNWLLGYRVYFGRRNLDNPLACRFNSIPESDRVNGDNSCEARSLFIGNTPSKTGFSIIDRTFYGAGLTGKTKTKVNQIPIQITVGLDLDYVIDKRTAYENNEGVKGEGPGRDEDNIAYNTDAFFQSQWFLNEKYTGLFGARLSRVNFEVKDYMPSSPASGSTRYKGISPVVGLTRHVSPALNIFLQAGRGFETPTLNEVLYNGSISAAKSRQLELGFKWRPDATTKVDGSIFEAVTKDDLVPNVINPTGSTWQNAKTRRQGFELSGLKLLSNTVAIRSAYTLLDAKYKSDGNVSSARVMKDRVMPGIPKQKFYAEFAWRSTGWILRPNQEFSEAAIEFNAVGEMFADSRNLTSTKVDSYETINLRASRHIKTGNQTLSFYGRIENLTDKKYVGSVVVDQSSGRYFEPGAPRNWLLGMKYTVEM